VPEALSYEKTAKTAEINGQTLHYHDAGEGPALVLLHGAGPGVSGWSNFGGNISNYAQNFRTIVVDLPGFGGSGQPDEYPVSYLRYAADAVAGLLDELGIAKAHLLGNSLGGSVVVRFLLTYPDRADRVVLMGPGSALSIGLFAPRPSEGIRRLMEFGAAPSRDKMESFLRTLVFDQSLVTEELIDDRYQVAINPSTGGGLAATVNSGVRPTRSSTRCSSPGAARTECSHSTARSSASGCSTTPASTFFRSAVTGQ
jgi:4,5:9,10-diseco-3-hydroxy-5,9,17-trioxoandrosta-1(10),2-diene-4-oate hydrolase